MCVVGDICVQRHGCVDVWPVYVVPQFMCSDLGYTYLAGDRWPDYRWSRSTRKCKRQRRLAPRCATASVVVCLHCRLLRLYNAAVVPLLRHVVGTFSATLGGDEPMVE